ncbi:MAG: DUF1553 domain-containing protein [Acidobacteria bacterium]|nr:DUF1553 domain-containing protein [Acidobacteriota bacterium]
MIRYRRERRLPGDMIGLTETAQRTKAMAILSRASVLLLLLLASLAAQAQQSPMSPKDHPPLPGKGRLAEASRVTAELAAKPATAPAAKAPRRNFIDEHIFGKMERDRVPHAPLATDEEFFRRVHIDLTGRIPDDAELRAFLADTNTAKRDQLVDKLVITPAFKAKWTYWFGDVSMTCANRVGNEGKNLYYKYVYDSIHFDRPYDELVRELLTARALTNWYVGPASYLARWVVIGATCEDTVHEDTADEVAIMSARHFLGVNLQCVSCHDGKNHLEKINLWLSRRKRDELWRQAAFFGGMRILRRVEVATTQDEYMIDDKGPGYDASARTVVRIPRRGAGPVAASFLLTGETPNPQKAPREEFARMITGHPQFARATVNRFWAEMMGVGIVDPVDDFDLDRQDPANPPPSPWTIQPSHPELLEALAADFRRNGHSIKRLLTLIAKSSAYQLSSRFAGPWKEQYAPYFARKVVRRLTAEEVHDAIVKATGAALEIPIRGTDKRVRYATETASPEDFKGPLAGLKDVNFFLEAFGQTNREYSERKNGGDITQAVLLMNSPFVLRAVKPTPGTYLAALNADTALNDTTRIERLFQRFLGRRPDAAELAQARDVVSTTGGKGFEDLQWLLLNKVDFIFNY